MAEIKMGRKERILLLLIVWFFIRYVRDWLILLSIVKGV